MTHRATVHNWMDKNYGGQHKTIRAIWYKMKPYIQECNTLGYTRGGDLNDKSTTKLIGDYLWESFIAGNSSIYGEIRNSSRVSVGSLPVILFTEKNTLLPFGEHLSEHITSFEYNASGQTNSYEIANIVLALLARQVDTLCIYGVVDFDKAGDDIYQTVINKFSHFFNVVDRQFDTDLALYEHYTQPNGEQGVELDAIYDLDDLVYDDLSHFLPSELFDRLAISYKKHKIFRAELAVDEKHKNIEQKLLEREDKIRKRIESYEYEYDFSMVANLNSLSQRVTVDKKDQK